MHAEALDWVQRCAPEIDGPLRILDVGGRDINGHPGHLFHAASTWEVVDLVDGPRVTWVGDVLDYGDVDGFDVVLCLEVAEHTPEWSEIIHHTRLLLRQGGRFIFTAAGPGRAPHSAVDGGELRAGEHYSNIDPWELSSVLEQHYDDVAVDVAGADVRAAAS